MTNEEKINTWKWRICKAGFTQKDFCARVGMFQGHLSDIIRGVKVPQEKTINKVERALKKLGV